MSLWRYGWWLDGSPGGLAAASSGTALAAGKYYWEVTISQGGADGTSGYGIIAGVANSSTVLTGTVCPAVNLAQGNCVGSAFFNSRANNPFEAANGWGYPVRAGGIAVETVGTSGTYGLCLDGTNKKLWYRNITDNSPAPVGIDSWAGGASAGDPATNHLGCDLTAIPVTGPVFVLCGASHGSGSAKGVGTVNFGASAFVGTAPVGFVSIESVFPGAALNPADNSNIVLSNGNLTFSGALVPTAFSPRPPDVAFDANVGYTNSVRSRFAMALAT